MGTARRMAVALVAVWLAVAGKAAAQIGLVADYGARSVTAFQSIDDVVQGTVFLPIEDGTVGDCSITPDEKLGFVTDFLGHVWVIDLTAFPPVLASGVNPIPIANPGEDTVLSPDGKFLLVCDGGAPLPIAVVDIATRTQVHTFDLGTDCNSLDVCGDGSVLVTSISTRTVRRLTLDAAGNLADTGESLSVTTSGEGPNNVYCAPGGRTGIVVSRSPAEIQSFTIPGLHRVDVRSFTTLGVPGISGVFSPGGDRFYAHVGSIYVFSYDPSTGALGAAPLFSVRAGGALTAYGIDQLALSPEGEQLFVPDGRSVRVYVAKNGIRLDALTSPDFLQPTGVCIASPLPRIEVAIEVRPGSVNPRSRGVMTVVVLTTPAFNAADVDPASVRFGPAGALAEHSSFEDVDSDGDLDLVLKIGTPQAGIRCGDTSVTLEGKTFGGRPIHGEAPIRTVGCPR